ncbi:MAG: hypothetical protein NTY50_09535 [Methylobacter sp.]|nr:hypothetical protein [Methylobacter sp.]
MMCIDFFSQNHRDPQICKLLQEVQVDKLLAWELEVATEHSPGPVSNEEFLYRQIWSPTHYDTQTNTLSPAAFDDASNKGMSVNRLKYTSEEQIFQVASNRVAHYNKLNPDKPQRSFPGVVRFVCDDIRNITFLPEEDSSPIRGCAVYDTAYENDQSHADICQIVKNKAHGRSVRSRIFDLANKFLAQNPFPTETV